MATGVCVGVGSAWWVERKVREQVARYLPDRVASDLAESAKRLGTDLRGAVSEGREVMRAREAELRRRVGERPGSAGTPRLRLVDGSRRSRSSRTA
jgi:hypothetical protein